MEHRNMSKIPMFPLPDNVARVAGQAMCHIQATAYFEDRWKKSNWECSWDTFELQKKQENTHNLCNRIGCLRFVVMHEKGMHWIGEILTTFVEKKLDSSIKAFGVLNVDFLTGDQQQHPDFLAMVLSRVPVHPWSAMVVALQSVPVFVSMSIANRKKDEFNQIIQSLLKSSDVSFHLQLGTNVATTQGLVCKRPLFAVCNGLLTLWWKTKTSSVRVCILRYPITHSETMEPSPKICFPS